MRPAHNEQCLYISSVRPCRSDHYDGQVRQSNTRRAQQDPAASRLVRGGIEQPERVDREPYRTTWENHRPTNQQSPVVQHPVVQHRPAASKAGPVATSAGDRPPAKGRQEAAAAFAMVGWGRGGGRQRRCVPATRTTTGGSGIKLRRLLAAAKQLLLAQPLVVGGCGPAGAPGSA